MNIYLVITVLLLCIICKNNAARILAYIPSSSYSHQVVFRPLWKELSSRGHQVTFLTAAPMNDATITNLTEINLNVTTQYARTMFLKVKESNPLLAVHTVMNGYTTVIDMHLQNQQFKNLLHSGGPFDLVIAEYLSLIPFALGEKFKCPSIGITSLEATELGYEIFGVPTHPILYPSFFLPFSKPETLSERIVSVLFNFGFKLYMHTYNYKQQDIVTRKHFGEKFPTVLETAGKISLLLENTEPLLSKIRSRVPTVIPIGGIHRVPVKPLPKELKILLDSSTNGFIYFSLGSNVQSKNLPDNLRQIILNTFAELPYTVLWKFESDHFPDVPKNVFISKWFQQTDVLKHPNIKLFITHGGLQSIHEAVFARVPLIGMPFCLDQPKNVKKMVNSGFGLSIDYKKLEKSNFKEIILEVILNPKYQAAISRVTGLVEDQPMNGLDRAVWWIEYVLRHKGAAHLRSPILDMPWYQYYMIDVITILGILVFLIVFIMRLMYKTIFLVIKNSFKQKLKKH